MIFATFSDARDKAKIAKAQIEMNDIYNSVMSFNLDTGAWPNGCLSDESPDYSLSINIPLISSALVYKPTAGPRQSGQACGWEQTVVDKWSGPYGSGNYLDAWGNYYYLLNETNLNDQVHYFGLTYPLYFGSGGGVPGYSSGHGFVTTNPKLILKRLQ